jgi:hypothetical protein
MFFSRPVCLVWLGAGTCGHQVLREGALGDADGVGDAVVLELAVAAQRVHRRGRDAKALGDVPDGQLDHSEACPERPLDRGTKGGTKLRDTFCGSVRSMREPEIA